MVLSWLQMRLRAIHRSSLHRIIGISVLVILVWSFIDAIYVHRELASYSVEESPPLGAEKIYIAALHWNSERILRDHWMNAVSNLAKESRRDNAFISILENGSSDDTKGALLELQVELEAAGIRNRFTLDQTTHLDLINQPPAKTGWVRTPRDQVELRRIPYLAGLRNRVMEPLYEMKKDGETFDKIVFLNDAAFSSLDVRNLLSTRGGEYAAACPLDFMHPPNLYDTFALRDSEGEGVVLETWPFFRSRSSRQAVKRNAAVPVSNCWNGIVATDAKPFYNDHLAFRGLSDSLSLKHLEASECCLVHVDNPLSRIKAVWLNPRVRVGYDEEAYNAVRSETGRLSTFEVWKAYLKNRILRWFTTAWFKNQVLRSRLHQWRSENHSHQEAGDICVVDEMHVLVLRGWERN